MYYSTTGLLLGPLFYFFRVVPLEVAACAPRIPDQLLPSARSIAAQFYHWRRTDPAARRVVNSNSITCHITLISSLALVGRALRVGGPVEWPALLTFVRAT